MCGCNKPVQTPQEVLEAAAQQVLSTANENDRKTV